MRVAISPELSAWVTARIAHYDAEGTEPYHHDEAPSVAAFLALPLIRHRGETFGLRPDGEVVRWSTADHCEPYRATRPVEDRTDWLSALVEGARRWPEWQALLPPRPSGAAACACVGHARFGPGGFICPICCGLGWV